MLILIDSFVPDDPMIQMADIPFGSVNYYQIDSNTIVLQRSPTKSPKAAAYAARMLGGSRVIGVIRDGEVERPSTPTNFVEFTTNRPTTFFETIGTGYVQQSPPFCPELHQALFAAGVQETGNLLVIDSLPTPDIRSWWRSYQISLITTETQPEGTLCRELELCYAPLALPEAMPISTLLPNILTHLPTDRGCGCDQTMATAKKFGKLTADWFENLSDQPE